MSEAPTAAVEAGGRPSPAGAAALLPRGRTAVLLVLVVAAAFVIRFDALRNDAPAVPPFGDGHNYHVIASALADGKGFVRPVEYERQGRLIATAEYPPALPVLLAVADKGGIDGEQGQRTLLCAVGALTVGLVGLAGRRLGLGVRPAWADGVGIGAALVAALHPAMVNTDVSLAAEPLAACLGAAVVLAALAVWDRVSVVRWVVLGVVLGVGCLVRSEFLLLVPVLLGGLAFHHRDLRRPAAGSRAGQRPALLGAGAAVAAVLVVLAPWTLRNALTYGRFVPVSNNLGSVMRGANCDLAYHGQFKGLWVTNVGAAGKSQVDPEGACFSGFAIAPGTDEADAAAELRSDGLSYVTDHAGEVPGVVAARLGRAVGLYQFDQQANFARAEGRDTQRERDGTRAFQLMAVIGLLGLAAGGWRHHERLIPLAVLLAVLVTVVVTYGNPRFRAAAEPSVVLLAVVAVADALWTIRRRSPSSVA